MVWAYGTGMIAQGGKKSVTKKIFIFVPVCYTIILCNRPSAGGKENGKAPAPRQPGRGIVEEKRLHKYGC